MVCQAQYKPELAVGYADTVYSGLIKTKRNKFQAFPKVHAEFLVPLHSFLPVCKIPDILQNSSCLKRVQKYDFHTLCRINLTH